MTSLSRVSSSDSLSECMYQGDTDVVQSSVENTTSNLFKDVSRRRARTASLDISPSTVVREIKPLTIRPFFEIKNLSSKWIENNTNRINPKVLYTDALKIILHMYSSDKLFLDSVRRSIGREFFTLEKFILSYIETKAVDFIREYGSLLVNKKMEGRVKLVMEMDEYYTDLEELEGTSLYKMCMANKKIERTKLIYSLPVKKMEVTLLKEYNSDYRMDELIKPILQYEEECFNQFDFEL
jgi:hypothetical protein